MASIENINLEIDKNKLKIAELQRKNRALESKRTELENLEIIKSVKAYNLNLSSLKSFLEAYAKGRIKTPNHSITEKENKENEKENLRINNHYFLFCIMFD